MSREEKQLLMQMRLKSVDSSTIFNESVKGGPSWIKFNFKNILFSRYQI